jgi:hypothetical protein
VIAIREARLPADHPFTIRAIINQAAILRGLDRPAEAEPLFGRGLAMQARSLPPDHLDIAYTRLLHGINLLELKRPGEAFTELEAARGIYARASGRNADNATDVMAWQARALVEVGQPARGLAVADETLGRALAEQNLHVEGMARWHRAMALAALGRHRAAVAEADRGISELLKDDDPDSTLLRRKIEGWVASQPPR